MKRILYLVAILLMMMCPRGFANSIKEPNVSGQFYDADPSRLSQQIDLFLSQAQVAAPTDNIQILIAPHAGYMYSGPVAAYAYKTVREKKYTTVVILAASHYYGLDTASVWAAGGFRTPLGVADVDTDFADKLMAADPQLVSKLEVFNQEHSLEVQIPFLQRVLKDFKIVPIMMGQVDAAFTEKLAAALNQVIGDRQDVLVVASSDMSHFFSGTIAAQLDLATLARIQDMDIPGFWEKGGDRSKGMCGFVPVTTAMYLAQMRGLKPQILKHATSGDTTGDQSRVVGYTSVIFTKENTVAQKMAVDQKSAEVPGVALLSVAQKKELLAIAQKTLEEYVRNRKVFEPQVSDPRLKEKEGAFVTLRKHGELRGCIGQVIGSQPLYLTVRDMAIAASSEDPRFDPVAATELKDIDLEISVLSLPRPVTDPQEIQMGVHGVIVSRGYHQGLFLPQVATENGWGREQFLSVLCSQKAGLPADAWKDPQTRLQIFTANVFSINDLK